MTWTLLQKSLSSSSTLKALHLNCKQTQTKFFPVYLSNMRGKNLTYNANQITKSLPMELIKKNIMQ